MVPVPPIFSPFSDGLRADSYVVTIYELLSRNCNIFQFAFTYTPRLHFHIGTSFDIYVPFAHSSAGGNATASKTRESILISWHIES